jgi:hypothetical protein
VRERVPVHRVITRGVLADYLAGGGASPVRRDDDGEYIVVDGLRFDVVDEDDVRAREGVLLCLPDGAARPRIPTIDGRCDECGRAIFWSRRVDVPVRRLCLLCAYDHVPAPEQALILEALRPAAHVPAIRAWLAARASSSCRARSCCAVHDPLSDPAV